MEENSEMSAFHIWAEEMEQFVKILPMSIMLILLLPIYIYIANIDIVNVDNDIADIDIAYMDIGYCHIDIANTCNIAILLTEEMK